jgi:hypothetical protein
MPVEGSNISRKQRPVSGTSSNPRNNLDPWARLASHVLVNAGREYRAVVAQINGKWRTKKEIRELRGRREAIRVEILDPLNLWTRYLNRDGEEMMRSLERDLAREDSTI